MMGLRSLFQSGTIAVRKENFAGSIYKATNKHRGYRFLTVNV